MRRLTFLGGKGGVGKTTIATALATRLATAGERTLLVSTDPAHSTGDLLHADLREPSPVAERLWAVEIDAAAAARDYVERIKQDAAAALSPEVVATVERHLDLAGQSPGTLESALFDRLIDLIDQCPGEWGRIVVDTAPTGHTLRLLTMPTVLTGWVEGLVRQRERVTGIDRMLKNMAGDDAPDEDVIVTRLRQRRDRFLRARQRLLEDAVFDLVVLPERLPIEETARAAAALDAEGLQVGVIIVNRVIPEHLDGPFLGERVAQQRLYLEEIERRFAGRRLVRVAHEPRDVTEADQLHRIAEQLGPARVD